MVHALEDRLSQIKLPMANSKDRLDKVEQYFEQVGSDMAELDIGLRELQGRMGEVQSSAVAAASELLIFGEVLSVLAELTSKVEKMGTDL